MAEKLIARGEMKRVFMAYVIGTSRVVINGVVLTRPGRPIKTDKDIPTDPRHAILVVPDAKSAKVLWEHSKARRIGLLEILTPSPVRLPFKLITVPHRKVDPGQFAAMYNLRGGISSASTTRPAAAPAAPNVPSVIFIEDKPKKAEPSVPTPPPPPIPKASPPVVEEAPLVVEEVEVEVDAPSDGDESLQVYVIVDQDLVGQIDWDSLQSDPSSLKITELRKLGKAFDPSPNGTSKAEIASEILRAARETGII